MDGQQSEIMEADNGQDDDISAANHWILPSIDFYGLWENLIYDSAIKENVSIKFKYLFNMKRIN